MKKKYCLTAVALLMLSQASPAEFTTIQQPVHVTNFTGSVPDKPENGFKNMTDPINVVSGPLERKLYYAQSRRFNAQTADEAYYYGIQPWGDGRAQVVFSYFGKGADVIDTAHCSAGADGGNGVSCSTKIPFALGVIYNFEIVLASEAGSKNVWEGYVTDTSSNVRTKIGAWATPKSIGYLSDSSIGFIEDIVGIRSCAEIPATSAYFGPGTSRLRITEQGLTIAVRGTIDAPYTAGVGVCETKVSVSSQTHDGGGRTINQGQGVK